jgi:hypothetical protein
VNRTAPAYWSVAAIQSAAPIEIARRGSPDLSAGNAKAAPGKILLMLDVPAARISAPAYRG